MLQVRIVLPAYNEEENLPVLLERIEEFSRFYPRFKTSLVLVNDGSVDTTPQIAFGFKERVDMEVEIINFIENKGLGVAISRGIQRGIEGLRDDDILVTMDADDTHNPFLIARMIQQLKEGSDLVIASRYREGARVIGVPLSRQITSWGARILFQLFYPIPGVRDYTSGFRAYKVSILKDIILRYGDDFLEEKGFACMAELLLKVHRAGAIIGELPMILRYDRKKGESKIDVSSTIFETLKLMWRLKA